jgi:Co/Zn/Cd efflux system component
MFKKLFVRYLFGFLRLFFAILIVYTVTVQFSANAKAENFDPTNFFSFFTIQSNLLASLVLLFSGAFFLTNHPEPRLLTLARGAVTVYMIVTAAVFAFLLADISAADPTVLPWANKVLHQLIPFFVILDWFLLGAKERINLKEALLWFVFPLLWLIYSFIRAALTGWYPYHFLDPKEVGNLGVILYILVISLAMAFVCFLLAFLTNSLQARKNKASLV